MCREAEISITEIYFVFPDAVINCRRGASASIREAVPHAVTAVANSPSLRQNIELRSLEN